MLRIGKVELVRAVLGAVKLDHALAIVGIRVDVPRAVFIGETAPSGVRTRRADRELSRFGGEGRAECIAVADNLVQGGWDKWAGEEFSLRPHAIRDARARRECVEYFDKVWHVLVHFAGET